MNWRHLTDEAIDTGFKEHVTKLFHALMVDSSEIAYERFKKELDKAKASYDKLINVLEL